MSKYDGLARTILQNVGGQANVVGLTHCVTRLRFKLKDEGKANTAALNNTDGIVTVIRSGGQYMLVIGRHVTDVYDAVCAAAPGIPGKKSKPTAAVPAVKQSVLQKLRGGFLGLFHSPKEQPSPLPEPETAHKEPGELRILCAPVTGHVRILSHIEDPVFSSEVLGRGCAIEPTCGEIVAPADGVINQLAETKHAVSMICDNGLDVLIYVGMETVELKGKGYEPHVKVGDHVEKGQLLFQFDMQAISAAGYALTTPVIVTNTDLFSSVTTLASGKVTAGQELLGVR